MNKGLFWFLAPAFFFLILVSCTRINESTDVGGDLIPAVDNVNTFEASFPADPSKYFLFNDSTRFFFSDNAALGKMNDPIFGNTTANVYFNVSFPSYGNYPFNTSAPNNPDSLKIDSVVLSLSYQGSYGDTSNGTQGVRVYEIAQNSIFRSDTAYLFTELDFATGTQLGFKTFAVNSLKDSITLIRKRDTTRVANVLRIPLSNSLGLRFANYDTTANPASGGFRNDSLFKSLFKGLAIKAEGFSGNGALSYFNLSDQLNTNLTIYYQRQKNGVRDTTSLTLFHATNGQANIINRQNGGDYANFLAAGSSPDGKLYIQSSPGSFASIKIPGLDTLKNKVIHRAELIVTKISNLSETLFPAPPRLFLDKMDDTNNKPFLFENDLELGADGSVNYGSFGGTLRTDNTYRFNITRHVQGIVTRKEPNHRLRLYAPLRANVYYTGISSGFNIPVNNKVAAGRVVVAGGNYTNPAQRMRLRIIYSNL